MCFPRSFREVGKTDTGNDVGFTLIEVLVATAVLVIVMGGLYQVLLFGLSMWEKGQAQTDEQQNIRIAANHIAREIRTAASFEIGANGSSIEMRVPDADKLPDNYPLIRYYFDGGNEIQRSVNGSGHNIVAYGVKSIRFSANLQGTAVTVEIEGRSGYRLETRIFVRAFYLVREDSPQQVGE